MGREDTHVYIVGTGADGVWESQAMKALFCRSLTVENHLLSYQEMRPLGGWLRQLAAIGADALRPFASSIDGPLEGYRVLSVKQKHCYMAIARCCMPLRMLDPDTFASSMCSTNPFSTALLRRKHPHPEPKSRKRLSLFFLFFFSISIVELTLDHDLSNGSVSLFERRCTMR
jgi:hypothetical protein